MPSITSYLIYNHTNEGHKKEKTYMHNLAYIQHFRRKCMPNHTLGISCKSYILPNSDTRNMCYVVDPLLQSKDQMVHVSCQVVLKMNTCSNNTYPRKHFSCFYPYKGYIIGFFKNTNNIRFLVMENIHIISLLYLVDLVEYYGTSQFPTLH